jgi:cytoskeletal protein CcmA (bactofilin family)
MRRAVALVCIVLFVLATLPATAAAQSDSRSGASIVIGQNETVDGFTAYAGTVVVRGTVRGDLVAYGGTVVIAPGGTVEGRVRAFSGSVRIDGTVTQSVVAYGGSIVVGDSGTIRGSLGAFGGQVIIGGTVGGDATVGAGSITLAETGLVRGDLTYDGDLNDQGGVVQGDLQRSGDLQLAPSVSGPVGILFGLYFLFADALLGAVLLLGFPRFTRSAADTVIAEPLQTFAVGLGTAVVVPFVLLLVAITVIGIPLALVGLVAFIAVLWGGSVLGRYAVGSWLLDFTEYDSRWLALAAGLVLVAILARIPFLGPVVQALVLLVGLGVVALAIRAAYTIIRETPRGLANL